MADKKLYFTEDHEWIEVLDDNNVRIGISDYAQDQLGDVVFVDIPDVDDEFDAKEEFATVESVKSVEEISVPLAGTVTKAHDELEDSPELVNDSPFEDGWIAEFKLNADFDSSGLMDQDAYNEYVEGL